jgi:membrane-associated phospholipid phosphatase
VNTELRVNKRLRKRLIIGLLLVILATILAVLAHFTLYFPGDVGATHLIQSLANPSLTSFMIIVSGGFTNLPAVLLVIACVVFIWWRLGRLEAMIMAAVGVLSPIANLIKLLVERPRPPASLVDVVTPAGGLGFPSGHAYFAATTLGILIYFVIKDVPSRSLKVFLVSGLVFIILLVGFSRVYLGDHWLSDVIESYIIAGGFLLPLTLFYEQRRAHKARHEKAHVA